MTLEACEFTFLWAYWPRARSMAEPGQLTVPRPPGLSRVQMVFLHFQITGE